MPKRKRYSRRHSRRAAPATSVVGYTRSLNLVQQLAGSEATSLVTVDFPDVVTPAEHTENRKILRVAGQAFFTATIAANQYAMAQWCLWAHPDHEDWPGIADYDPFNDGPGETGFKGLLAPRTFARRTFVLAAPASGSSQTISEQHMIRSKAERLLRPGWKLSAGLYTKGTANVTVRHLSLLRAVVAG